MSVKVGIDELSQAVYQELEKYNKLTSEQIKDAVKTAATQVKNQIRQTAPKSHMKRSGTYARSWTMKNTAQSENSLEITVYSQHEYPLAHLLEHGHATVNGGRTKAQPHIAPAEQAGIERLNREIEKVLKDG